MMLKTKVNEIKEFSTYLETKKYSNNTKEKLKQLFIKVVKNGKNDINLDLADIKCILEHNVPIYMGSAEATGNNSAKIAIELAMVDASENNMVRRNIASILICFSMHPDLSIIEISDAMDIIDEYSHENTDIILGTVTDESMSVKSMKVHMGTSKNPSLTSFKPRMS